VVSCTASPHLIVGAEELALVSDQRAGRPLLLIDIAVPRDIDPSVRELPGITLYDMDDLQRTVARNLDVQEAEASRARTIVDDELERFNRWLSTLDVVPTIASLRERGDEIVEQVLRENEGRWESLSDSDRERIELMARAVVSRMLHEPTTRLKRATGDDSAYVYLQALRELFGLDAGVLGERDAQVTSLDERRAERDKRSGERR
jgi:glutamyl-tRNA reductase